MSQPLPDAESRVEMSPNLRVTLQRAGSYAAEQSHRFVTIEHILLALNEDPDAELMLQTCSVDQGQLHSDISGYLGLLEDRLAPGETAQPVLDPEAARIVNSAVIAAQKSRRNEVNGAIVLAAIIGDGRTSAANMLGAQGLTFQAAIEALQKSQNPSPAANAGPAPLPHMQNTPMGNADIPPAANQNAGPPRGEDGQATANHRTTTEDVLADARRRVEAMREPVQQPAPSPSLSAPEPPAEPEIEERVEPEARPLQTEDSLARFERRPTAIDATRSCATASRTITASRSASKTRSGCTATTCCRRLRHRQENPRQHLVRPISARKGCAGHHRRRLTRHRRAVNRRRRRMSRRDPRLRQPRPIVNSQGMRRGRLMTVADTDVLNCQCQCRNHHQLAEQFIPASWSRTFRDACGWRLPRSSRCALHAPSCRTWRKVCAISKRHSSMT